MAELSEVVVGVEIAPAQPLRAGHLAPHRVCGGEVGGAREGVQFGQQESAISVELAGWDFADFLADFGRGGNSGRPLDRQIKGDRLEDRAWERERFEWGGLALAE